jgi:hypothetical protein
MPDESLAAALVAAQMEMPAATKVGSNPHFNSKFVTLDELIDKTRPVLNKHGLAIMQFAAVGELGQPVLTTVLIHGPSGEKLESDMPLFVEGQNMQKLGSAITYARRYAWQAALGVAAEEDDDGNASSAPAEKKRQAKKPADGMISDAQRRRMFAIAKQNDVDDAMLRQMVFDVTGQESTSQIPTDRYDELIGRIEREAVPF